MSVMKSEGDLPENHLQCKQMGKELWQEKELFCFSFCNYLALVLPLQISCKAIHCSTFAQILQQSKDSQLLQILLISQNRLLIQ